MDAIARDLNIIKYNSIHTALFYVYICAAELLSNEAMLRKSKTRFPASIGAVDGAAPTSSPA